MVLVTLEGPAWLSAEAGLCTHIDGFSDPSGWLKQRQEQEAEKAGSPSSLSLQVHGMFF
jgi:hypothetical protein